ncbi:MAG: ATP-binding protein [Erysipelotrichales bacterium]|nr:ATP-binding protein [Erysipelotrichales bacterium]
MEKDKETKFPESKKFKMILILGFVMAKLPIMLLAIILISSAIAGIYLLEEAVIKNFSKIVIGLNLVVLVLSILALSKYKRATKAKKIILIVFLVNYIKCSIIVLIKFEQLFFFNFIIQSLITFVFVLSLCIEYILDFANINYSFIENKQKQSYDVLAECDANISRIELWPLLYKGKVFIFFVLSTFLTFFLCYVLYDLSYAFYVVPENVLRTIMDSVMYIFLVNILYFIFAEFYVNSWRYSQKWIIVQLIFLIALSFLKTDNYDLSEAFNLIIFLVLFQNIVFLLIIEMKNTWKNTNILNHYKSKYEKDEDLIYMDEPVDNIKNLQENCLEHLNTLHNVFEKQDTKAPMIIALSGTWGWGKSSVAKTLVTQLSKINKYSFAPINENDSYKKSYFIVNIDLLKFDNPVEINNYVHDYINTLCKIFLVPNSKNVELYLDKILELIADVTPQNVSNISKIVKRFNNKRFYTMEELKGKFQGTINDLLNKSKREGIILIVDDIDRLPKDDLERKKIYNFLKEFYNIVGLKVLLIRGHTGKDISLVDNEELQKFINVEYNFYEAYSRGLQDEYFNKIIGIAAKSLSQENGNPFKYEKLFNLFDRKLATEAHSFHYFLNSVLLKYCASIKLIGFDSGYEGYSIIETINIMNELFIKQGRGGMRNEILFNIKFFLEFLHEKSHNPRDYKRILRKALLEKSSIFKAFFDDYKNFVDKDNKNNKIILNKNVIKEAFLKCLEVLNEECSPFTE